MRLLHISVAIVSFLLVFVSVIRAQGEERQSPLVVLAPTQVEEDRILDALDAAIEELARAPGAKSAPLGGPEIYDSMELDP